MTQVSQAAREAAEPKPCPFCGSEEISHGWSAPGFDGSMQTSLVECHNCNAMIYTPGGEDAAIAAWNTRTNFEASIRAECQDDWAAGREDADGNPLVTVQADRIEQLETALRAIKAEVERPSGSFAHLKRVVSLQLSNVL